MNQNPFQFKFTLSQVEMISGIDKKIIRGWQQQKYLNIGMGSNAPANYTKHDICKIVLFARLISVGAKKPEASTAVNDPRVWRNTLLNLTGPFTRTEINLIAIQAYVEKRILSLKVQQVDNIN